MKPKRTILCVDDDERSLSIRKVMLETRGYRVVTCPDPQKALQIVSDGGIDLIIADLMMPKMTGAELIAHAKADCAPRADHSVLRRGEPICRSQ